MKHYLKLASVAFALLAAPVSAQTNVAGVTIDDSFVQDGIEWQRGRGSVDFAVKVFSTDEGTMKFCGAVMLNGAKGGAARKVPRAFVFEVNGRKVVRGFHWMPLVSPNKGFVGSEAACRVYPNVKINKDTKFGFSMSQTSFHG